mgnify:FL=1
MNRREFVKKGSLVALAASLPFTARANVIKKEQNVFERVFQPIQFGPGQLPKFPLNCILSRDEINYATYVSVLNGREKVIGGDYVLVPTPFNNKKKASDYDYGAVLLTAGLSRNMLVYDSSCDGDYISRRLQALLSMTIRRNYGKKKKNRLTDIFIHESRFVENPSDKIKVHRVGTEIWNKVISIYEDFPEICLNNKTNLVVGVSTVTQEFVKPIKSDGSYGIATLDNRNIILGAF